MLRSKDAFGELSLSAKKAWYFLIFAIFYSQVCFRAKTKVTVLKISRQDYLPVIKGALRTKAKVYLDTLSSIPFFKSFSEYSVEKLASGIRQFSYAKKQNVFKENDDVEYLYIVREGEFEATKKVSENGLEKQVKLRNMTMNEVFGDEEIIMGMEKRNTTVQCVSITGIILGIKKNLVSAAIDNDGIERQLEARVVEQAGKTAEKIGTSLKFLQGSAAKSIGGKKFGKRKFAPLTKDEYRKIKNKYKKQKDEAILSHLKQVNPSYHVDISFKYYDSRIVRGEEDGPYLSSVMDSGSFTNRSKMGSFNSNTPIDIIPDSLKTYYPFSKETEILQKQQEASPHAEGSKSCKFARNKSLPSMRMSTFAANPSKITLTHFPNISSPMSKITENLLATRREFYKSIRRRKRMFEPPAETMTFNVKSKSPSRKVFKRPILARSQKQLAPVSEMLSEIASEFVGHYKSMAEDNANVIKSIELPEVVQNIFQSNQYVQNMIKTVAFIHRRSSQKVGKSKHNLFRFKQQVAS